VAGSVGGVAGVIAVRPIYSQQMFYLFSWGRHDPFLPSHN